MALGPTEEEKVLQFTDHFPKMNILRQYLYTSSVVIIKLQIAAKVPTQTLLLN